MGSLHDPFLIRFSDGVETMQQWPPSQPGASEKVAVLLYDFRVGSRIDQRLNNNSPTGTPESCTHRSEFRASANTTP